MIVEEWVCQPKDRPGILEGTFLTEAEMGIKRGDPYIHVKSLSGLLAGEQNCRWAAWFLAHYRDYDKEPSDFDSVKWRIEHTALLENVAEMLDQKSYSVAIEGQNYFTLRGKKSGIMLAGQPDIIAVKGNNGLILDAKTGKPKESHAAQVMTYMWAVPAAFRPQYDGITFQGRVVYKDGKVDIRAEEIDQAFCEKLIELIEKVGGLKPLRKVPGFHECRFCTISKKECPQRMVSVHKQKSVDVDDF